jgi:hypothetical protein
LLSDAFRIAARERYLDDGPITDLLGGDWTFKP